MSTNFWKGVIKIVHGNRIKLLREQLGLTQTELAEKIGLTQAAIMHFEKGYKQPSQTTLVAIADVLDCSTDYLLGRTESS